MPAPGQPSPRLVLHRILIVSKLILGLSELSADKPSQGGEQPPSHLPAGAAASGRETKGGRASDMTRSPRNVQAFSRLRIRGHGWAARPGDFSFCLLLAQLLS